LLFSSDGLSKSGGGVGGDDLKKGKIMMEPHGGSRGMGGGKSL